MRRRRRRGHHQHEFGPKASPHPPDARLLSVKPRLPQAGAFSFVKAASVARFFVEHDLTYRKGHLSLQPIFAACEERKAAPCLAIIL